MVQGKIEQRRAKKIPVPPLTQPPTISSQVRYKAQFFVKNLSLIKVAATPKLQKKSTSAIEVETSSPKTSKAKKKDSRKLSKLEISGQE